MLHKLSISVQKKMNCSACFNPATVDEVLVCAGCKSGYHYECLGIPREYLKSNVWFCTTCNNVTRRPKHDNTPVRGHYERSPLSTIEADMSVCDESLVGNNTVDHNVSGPNSTCNNTTAAEFSMEILASLLDSKLADVKRDLVMIDSKLGTTKQEIFAEVGSKFTNIIDRIKQEFSETTDFLSDQIKGFQVELLNVNKRLKALELENSRLNAELLSLKNKPSPPSDVTELHDVIDQMHTELNERDQELLLNDIEISGVPEHQGESTIHITIALSQKLGMQLEEADIVSAHRVGPLKTTSSGRNVAPAPARGPGESPEQASEQMPAQLPAQRPRPLVVRFTRRQLRDDVLRNTRVRRNLTTSDIGLPQHSPCKVYINERLTKANRKLLWRARQAGGAAGWRFVWTKEGRIYAKRTDGKDNRAIRIRAEKDVGRIFGVDPTTSYKK